MNSFRLFNIKSFRDSGDINLKPITILVGQNSSGKSSLLRFPAVFAQTANYPDKNPPLSFFGDLLDFGNFEDIVFGKNITNQNEIAFSITYTIDIAGRIITRYLAQSGKPFRAMNKKVTILVYLKRKENSLKVKSVSLDIEGRKLCTLELDEKKHCYSLGIFLLFENGNLCDIDEHIEFSEKEIQFEKFFPVFEREVFEPIIKSLGYTKKDFPKGYYSIMSYVQGFSSTNPLPGKKGKQVAQVFSAFSYVTDIMTLMYRCFMSESKNKIAYIGPFRQNPSRIYRYSESLKAHVGTKGENIGDILVGGFKESRPVFDNVSKWLKDHFGYELKLNDLGNNYFQIMLRDESGIESNIIDVGFGVSQVLPIVLEICLMASQKNHSSPIAKNNSIVLIEQPELHLHPAAQTSLADLFAMCVEKNPDARLVIETHSEHLISKLQVLIADNECPLTKEMVQILYVDKQDDGTATIQEMKINDNGKFLNTWPSGFFDQGYHLSLELFKKASFNKSSEARK